MIIAEKKIRKLTVRVFSKCWINVELKNNDSKITGLFVEKPDHLLMPISLGVLFLFV